MVPVTYGNARVSKTERDDKNLETHAIREKHILRDSRYELMSQVRLKKIIAD